MKNSLVAVVLVLICCGCSSFPRDFQAAVRQPRDATSIDGPWQGTWQSEGGHHGQLRCLLTRNHDGYLARFEAKFWGMFTAHYSVNMVPIKEQSKTRLMGEANLGFLAGGTYQYAGAVSNNRFDSFYKSSEDQGNFHMTRPPSGQ